MGFNISNSHFFLQNIEQVLIEQKGMPLNHYFAIYSPFFLLSFFMREEKSGKE